jgi:hypothetical protein
LAKQNFLILATPCVTGKWFLFQLASCIKFQLNICFSVDWFLFFLNGGGFDGYNLILSIYVYPGLIHVLVCYMCWCATCGEGTCVGVLHVVKVHVLVCYMW